MGAGHQRNSRSVSSDTGERGIRRQAQLSHSTPQVRERVRGGDYNNMPEIVF